MNDKNDETNINVSRRGMLHTAAGIAMAGAATSLGCQATATTAAIKPGSKAVNKGNINQSIVHWCFSKHWDIEKTSQIAKSLGCKSIELVGPEDWDTLKKHGLTCAVAPNGMPGPPFVKGFNNPKYHDEVITRTKKMIDDCAKAGIKSVIAFNGYKWKNAEDDKSGEISLEEGAENCVKGFNKIVDYAEKKKVTIVLEMLNTRADDHPMKGHPGYQGDHTDYCVDIIKRVKSPALKLLFDVYHVQIMDGDVIRRIGKLGADIIGHVHTAGNPGRGELDNNQEIYYPPIMKALLDIKYTGFVGQEFIPVGDPLTSLTNAVALCDV
jgi:sugar phosphate isomerase/epimerase